MGVEADREEEDTVDSEQDEHESADACDHDEEGTAGMLANAEQYDETEDPDFNPVYCEQTLSDIEVDENAEDEEDPPQEMRLADGECMLKVPVMAIPSTCVDDESMEEA